MMPLAALAVSGCLAVAAGSDQIVAGDLAAAIAGLTVPAPETPVAIAPAPGVQRVFHVPELRRMAERYSWAGEIANDVCVERPVAPVDPAQLMAAMRKAMPEAEITLIDYGRQPVPAGELEFPAAALRPGAAGGLWIGYVRYAKTRHFAVWARVKVRIPVTRVLAAAELVPAQAIAADQVRIETQLEYPPALPVLSSADSVIGKWPRAAIRAGSEIRAAMLQDPQAVMRGDTVTVAVTEGAAHLELEAIAEGSGAVGETIPVLNPDSKKRFPARVEGKGRVSAGIASGKVNP